MNGKNNEHTQGQKLKAETRKTENPKGEVRNQSAEVSKAHFTPALSPERRGSESHEELLTAEEVAALLRVTVRTVERWQQEGVLPYLRMGHAIRFHWPTVVSHLLAHFTVCKIRRTPIANGGAR